MANKPDTEMDDLSNRQTYIKAPQDKPIGLELKSFDLDNGVG